jgi:hypothetical protein
VFRWWSSTVTIVLDALLEDARVQIPKPETGSLEGDLTEFLSQTFRALSRTGDVVRVLMAEAQVDSEFAEIFRTRFIAKRRDALRQVVAPAGGPERADPELLLDLAFGPMWYRLMLGHAPLDTAFARALARAVAATATGEER